tara:strand:+ start:787 stop:1533 length:747 start_codon:yes stop_codon:yes gene_type:complete
MHKLVLLRHGQSEWNLSNQFTGWTDVGLTEIGKNEARESGETLTKAGFKFDVAHTSVLKRAIETMNLCIKKMDCDQIPINYHWQLNERHYGALQGLNKIETAKKYGDKQVLIWRRSYDIRPPELDWNDERHPRFDELYKNLSKDTLPSTECLKDTVERFLPCWEKKISPDIINGKNVLIVAHGNSLRALIKYLDKIDNKKILELNIPTGVPLVYELDKDLKPLKHYYLGNQDEIQKKAAAVAGQSKTN